MSNGEILNEAEVDFLLKGADEQAQDQQAPELDDAQHTVTMRGDLDQINLADIFQTLAMSQLRGVLRVRNALDERQVYCSNGYARILVPNRVTLRRLGQRMVQAGVLSSADLRSALVAQKKERLPLGQLLVRDGLISEEDLDEMVGMQVAEDLFSLFTWQHGTFEFFKGDGDGDRLGERFENCPEYEINSLLLEVARRSDEWSTILQELGNLDEIPQRIAEPADMDALDDNHRLVLQTIDGNSTYRQLADATTAGLFDYCRAARDLAHGNIIGPLDEPQFLQIARELADEGEHQRAIVLLQSLREREGERDLEIVRGMAEVLEAVDEKRQASQLLLEAAQRSPVPEDAIELARNARALVPYEITTLSFLRTVLVAHADADSQELEKITLDLLDALLDADRADAAIDIIVDAKLTDTLQPQYLIREAKARQKAQDPAGAIQALEELARHYEAIDNRPKAIEMYEAILRLDSSRKDVQRTVAQMRRTRAQNVVRIGVAAALLVLLLGSGVIWWQQSSLAASIAAATEAIQTHITADDLAAARSTYDEALASIGDCDALQDLKSRIEFAAAADQRRAMEAQRTRQREQLKAARHALDSGDLTTGFDLATALHDEQPKAIVASFHGWFDRTLDELDLTAKKLGTAGIEAPSQLLDHDQMAANLKRLEELFPTAQQRMFRQLRDPAILAGMPAFVDEVRQRRLDKLLTTAGKVLERAVGHTEAYADAIANNESQRQLDPVFQEAVQREQKLDFQGALELYRKLLAATDAEAPLYAHFAQSVSRNATISEGLKRIGDATAAGDYATAFAALDGLRQAHPDVPFDTFARLPLRIVSFPAGAAVRVGNQVVGETPLTLARCPADALEVQLEAPGFEYANSEFRGDGEPAWVVRLTLAPTARWQYDRAIDTRPARCSDGSWLFVDRSGGVQRRSADLQRQLWSHDTGDLSGCLTTPAVFDDLTLIASLDGPLRALALADGELRWQLPDMPSEVAPLALERHYVIATTDARLHLVEPSQQRQRDIALEEPAHGRLLRHRDAIVVIGENGLVTCLSAPDLTVVWKRRLEGLRLPPAIVVGDVLVVCDDQGVVFGLNAYDGEVVWRRELETNLLGAPCAVGDTVYLPASKRLLRLRAADGQDLEAVPAPDGNWAGAPVTAGSGVLLPHSDGYLQLVDDATGQLRYVVHGSSRAHLLPAGDGSLLVTDREHVVRHYANVK